MYGAHLRIAYTKEKEERKIKAKLKIHVTMSHVMGSKIEAKFRIFRPYSNMENMQKSMSEFFVRDPGPDR